MKTLLYIGAVKNVGRFGYISPNDRFSVPDDEAAEILSHGAEFVELPVISLTTLTKTAKYQVTNYDDGRIISMRDSVGSELVTNGGFSDTTSWTAYNGSAITAVGSGQTGNCLSVANGTDLVLNGGFASTVTSWTAIGGSTNTSAASGESGNCLSQANASSTKGGAYQSITTVAGRHYKLTYYFKKGTAVSAKLHLETVLDAADLHTSVALTDATWTVHTVDFIATTAATIIRVLSDSAVTGETSFWDTISLTTTELGGAYQTITTVAGSRYLLTAYFKKGTAVSGSIVVESALAAADLSVTHAGLTDAAWAIKTVEFLATTTATTIRVMVDSSVAGQTALFDTVVMIAIVGADVVLPGDLVLNGAFTSAATSWTAVNSSLASGTGGQSGNCLTVTNSGSAAGSAYQTITTVIGARYHLKAYFKKGTGVSGRLVIESSLAAADIFVSDAMTYADWTVIEKDFYATSTTTVIRLLNVSAVSAETSKWDSVSLMPCVGFKCEVHFDATAVGHLITVQRNGVAIDSVAADATVTLAQSAKGFLYVGGTVGWRTY
jgi:hypothetical protein